MRKKEAQRWQQRVQQRLVIWIVLTVCFQILTIILKWRFLEYVAWLAAIYCLILMLLWLYFTWQIVRNSD